MKCEHMITTPRGGGVMITITVTTRGIGVGGNCTPFIDYINICCEKIKWNPIN